MKSVAKLVEMGDYLDRKLCPLCQGENLCQVESFDDCWCIELSVPSGLLALVPDALRNQSCICEHCVRDYMCDAAGFKFRLEQRVVKH